MGVEIERRVNAELAMSVAQGDGVEVADVPPGRLQLASDEIVAHPLIQPLIENRDW